MSDIDPIWESEYIIDNLLFWDKSNIKNEKELAYIKKYLALSSAYHDKERVIQKYKNMILNNEIKMASVNRDGVKDANKITRACIKDIHFLQRKIDEESAILLTYENELVKLENTETIKEIGCNRYSVYGK